MAETATPDIGELVELVHEEQWEAVGKRLRELHPVDIAEVINRAPASDRERLFDLLDDSDKPGVLAELEELVSTDVLETLTDHEISEIVEEMPPDDAADVLGELPEERSAQVLELLPKEESEEVRKLLTYEEDTAGGIMSPDVVAMRGNQTVGEALDAIAYLDTREKFHVANVVDDAGRMIGYVDLWELLRERDRGRRLSEAMHTDFCTATVDMDQEEVAQLMSRYDLSVVPVVDRDGVLVGRVTHDDVIDVMEEEASEDILRMAGSNDTELEGASVLRSCVVRLPWLLVTLGGGFITSLILRHFHHELSSVIVLAAFVPVVLAMGGNTGIQSSTLVVRRIALGGMGDQSIPRLLGRELMAGALMGSFCGLVIGGWAWFVIAHSGGGTPLADALHLAGVVALALFSAMSFAAVFGALVPAVIDRLHFDPAVASGPFVTIANDISALLIYFGVALLLLRTML